MLFVEALGHFAHLDQARLHRQLSIADDLSHAIPQIEKARVITGGVVAVDQGRSDELDVFLFEEAVGLADLANLVEEGLDRAIGHSRAIALAILKPALSPCIQHRGRRPSEALFSAWAARRRAHRIEERSIAMAARKMAIGGTGGWQSAAPPGYNPNQLSGLY
jgi:hypothetical protein